MAQALTVGDRLLDYELEAPLGAGGFGQVWRARHTALGDTVAIAEYLRTFKDWLSHRRNK